MTASIELKRNLIGEEDALLGLDTVTQTRGGTEVTITKLNAGSFPYKEGVNIKQKFNKLYTTLDAIPSAASATFNLLLDGAAYTPTAAENLQVSVNTITQPPGTAYTVAGSVLTFTETLSASDVIDYILAA